MPTAKPADFASVNKVSQYCSKGPKPYKQAIFLNQHRPLFVSILFSFFFISVNAQEAISASGDHFYGSDLQLSWTLGELAIETYDHSGDTLLTQGMHQSKLIISTIEEDEDLDVKILAYPNPTVDFVQLEVESNKDEKLSFILYQMNGSVLAKGKLIDNQVKVPMRQYADAVYLLYVFSGNKMFKLFKIIKKD